MATPAEHATAAADALTTSKQPTVQQTVHAQRAQVHAILAGKTGAGDDYAAAEGLLTQVESSATAVRDVVLAQAHAHALLAP